MSHQPFSATSIRDLPEDILYLIIQYLPPIAFLRFCATSKTLQQNHDLRFSASYWRSLTRSTFRVPNQPVVAHDGRRWMSLYRRMQTQTKVYTWGHDDGGCLGTGFPDEDPRPARSWVGEIGGRFLGVRTERRLPKLTWPREMKNKPWWGTVADLQCGGWSTTVLNSHGTLYTVGIVDMSSGPSRMDRRLVPDLRYPPGFIPTSKCHYDAFTAIKQFSAGRSHILALSDNGRIWSWDATDRPSVHIKFLTIDLVEGLRDGLSSAQGRVTKVVAGWDRSSAYIIGQGVVIWVPSNVAEIQGQSDQSTVDGMLVLEWWSVPLTAYRDPPTLSIGSLEDAERDTGEVTNWIVLTQFVVFTTTTGRLFISRIFDGEALASSSICLNSSYESSQSSSVGEYILDVQGAYQHFAIFKRDGTVLVSTEDRLREIWAAHQTGANPPLRPFSKVPCLQNAGVISLAFGDHHYQALHSDGSVTSYGRELAHCGALGLGGADVTSIRGMIGQPGGDFLREDKELLPECYDTGRRVFFDEERGQWLKWMDAGLKEPKQDVDRRRLLLRSDQAKLEVSEWFEEKLRGWDLNPPWTETGSKDQQDAHNRTADKDDEDDGLPAYFALSVAAGGWHSAALVLVNEAKAKRAAERCIEDGPRLSDAQWIWEQRGETFPKLRLSSGEVLGLTSINDRNDRDVLIHDLGRREYRAVEHMDL